MKVNPYLNFDGNAEEAFNFYKSVFGGEFQMLMRFKDMPPSDQPMQESEANKIMHVALPIGKDTMLMASDVPSHMVAKLTIGTNVYISLSPETLEEARRLYEALSAGGNVEMPLEKMFWGDYFASFADKFGIQWMINVTDK